jgi:hypothetical protein
LLPAGQYRLPPGNLRVITLAGVTSMPALRVFN